MLFCWGDGVPVQVPLLDKGERGLIAAPREIQCLRDRPVKEVSCGAEHSVFLLTDGTVYSFGKNDSGQLGRKTGTSALDEVMALNTETIVNVACGKHHTLALCENGSVFAWGAGTYGQLGRGEYPTAVSQPRKVNHLEVPTVQIRCGHYHSLALSRDGTVYSWGQNTYGQLGNGKDLEKQQHPQRVRSLTGIPVAQIAAGESHSFALSLSGAVYGWGRNNHGQLGLKDREDREIPCHVNPLKRLNVSYISCGNQHSVVLTQDGAVFTCGDGSSGQLGRTGNVTSFQKVANIKDEVSQIACGSYHTLAYIPSSDLVVSFGLANREKTERASTRNQVHCESQSAKVHKIFAGANINFIQTQLPIPAVDLRHRDSKEQMLTFDATVVKKWISTDECSNERINAKNEIGLIFSSSSCLVGSFLKKSDGDQCKTGGNLLSVDMEAAREMFQKISEKDWIVNKITSSLASKLIPHLKMMCSDEEALMIYLILPECPVMQHKNNISTLLTDFVKAIAHLDPASKDTLGKYWSTLESSYLNTIVEMIKNLLTQLVIDLHSLYQSLPQSQYLLLNQMQTDLKEGLDVLELVYKANTKSKHRIPQSNFYISELQRLPLNILTPSEGQWADIILMILSYPFIFDLIVKAQLLRVDSTLKKQKAFFEAAHFMLHNSLARSPEPPRCGRFMLKVNHRSLVADTFNTLKNMAKADLQKELVVEFAEEPGIDLETVKKKFFVSVFEKLVHPSSKMFIYFQNFRTIWFPSQVSVPIKDYFLLGVLCGLVVYHACLVSMPLPLALFKKLLAIKPSLEDLLEVEPDLHNVLQNILKYDEVEDLEFYFMIYWEGRDVEIIPNGKRQLVTKENREKFVEACLNYVFKTSIKKPFEEFKKGFYHILDEKMIKLFQPQELKDILIGSTDYDWQMLEENTVYQGKYHKLHPTIRMFWEVFHQLVLDEKKLFLLFVTGFSQVPVMGMKCVNIVISSSSLTEGDYPETKFCYNILYLPEYTSSEALRTKLVTARFQVILDSWCIIRSSEEQENMLYCWEPGSQPEARPELEDVLKGEQIQHLCRRDGFTIFVLANGKVYKKVDGGKPRPGQFNYFKEQKIHFADCGRSHILFLSETGSVFHSEVKLKGSADKPRETFITKPQLLKSLSENNIIQVTCGNNHSLALSKDGQVFAWGQNTFGQLGLGKKDPSPCNPETVKRFSGIPVAQIAAGGEHSCALTVSGAVLAWGRNNHGQLGLKDTEDILIPTHVQLLACKRTIYISCGEEHTAVLTKDGFVFTFGAGAYGQLGHNSTKDEIKPRLVSGLFGKKVSQIACGRYHTLVLTPSSGTIYSFGCGEMGQLRNIQSEHAAPFPIKLMDASGNGGAEDGCSIKRGVRRIFAGANQSFAVCYDEENLVSSRDQSLLIPLKRIMRADNLLEKELRKNTRKAIIRAYSSSQIINASFLDVRKDNHFKTNRRLSGLDMSSVNQNFENLAKNISMLSKVTNAILRNLIPSLPCSPACVEALRVYLVLPELVAVLEEPMNSKLTESLTRAILSLEESYFEVLECWWRAMPFYFFKRLVKIYREKSEQLLRLTMAVIPEDTSDLQNSLKILQALNKVNSTRDDQIRQRNFKIPVMEILDKSVKVFFKNCFPNVLQTDMNQFINEVMMGNCIPQFNRVRQYLSALHEITQQLIPYPCIFDMDTKLNFLKIESQILQSNAIQLQVNVSRTAVLQDLIKWYRSHNGLVYFRALKVTFNNEPCFGPGVTQEFFTLFSEELQNDERIFTNDDESNLLWFPNRETEMEDIFHLVGILCGIALSNNFVCNFHFPLALYKKLLHVQTTLEDLKELLPTIGASLQDMLNYEYDDIEEEYCQNFVVAKETEDGRVAHELIADGANIPVQKHNRKQFVDAFVDYKFNVAVEKQFKAFSEGFRRAFPLPIVDLFLPEELMAIIHGNTNYNWKLLEQNTTYYGYQATDRIIRDFWEVFESLLGEEKKQFIAFLSGSERLPAGGIGRISIKICRPRTNFEPDLSYPRAYTCTRSLELPNYSTKELLRERLLHAIEHTEFCAEPP
ncbi:probable E3 ubiquitin-protein ligase HERC4 [Pristis pectinata]|uniref:probable E3 ubiquitin-protein ligase HERC4 n=1 Tax=Pristis pectinata TaxID=685728 RepID=UPI00223DC089|nr:probable E3 ubiquitin-protein ligase HERC4 [Pristis pectinata]